ncbi:nuclear transport factor 2 family protein [Streptomyces sp. NPDC060187]|uniref:nuclear transport factor 2 family protein n=1 Tax=Streptomyces sp. NPDC060187 TaxID=3347067 RepID=UPI00366035FF
MTVELMATAEHAPHREEFAALYAQVQQFYAQQMRILDADADADADAVADGGEARWAATFTEDAVVELPLLPAPLRARAGLTHYARAAAERRRRAGSRLHHWVGMLDVRPRPDGTLHTRCSALAHATPPGATSKVLYVCVMEDVLVRARGTWRTAHRRITRDDLA